MKSRIEFDNRTLAIVLVVGIALLMIYLFSGNSPVVSAQGYSSLKADPDVVSANINIEARDESAQTAKEMHSEINALVLAELDELGISEDEIELGYYSISPNYVWENNEYKQKGFIASSNIIVKASDFDRVPAIVDAAIDSGAIVSYINFELSTEKQNEYKKMALEEAGKDAKAKAESTAAGIGKKLGRLVSIQSEEFYYPGPIPFYARAAEDSVAGGSAYDADEAKQAALNIAPRKIDVTANVRVNYKLRSF